MATRTRPSARTQRQRPTPTAELRIGCSGWNYTSWRGTFYPPDMPPAAWLRHYAATFDTVEVNNTFYRLPEASTFAAWRDQTPDGFRVAVKASRYLTHIKRLRDPAEPIDRLFSRAAALGPRLGPVLYQLPSNFHFDLPRLTTFLEHLPRSAPGRPRQHLEHVMEFRHRSWYVDETYALLERMGVTKCQHDKAGSGIDVPVGPSVYVRFHGTSGHYHGSYDTSFLEAWAERLTAYWRAGRNVYAYFNNDPDSTATQNALTLRAHVAAVLGSG